MASGTYRQDLPPKGGFNPIDFTKRVNYKKTNGIKILGIALGVKVAAWFYVRYNVDKMNEEKIETNDARLAESVFRLAETDRVYLKHLRACRDEEREVMKNVPGWEVGTLFGDPIYHKEKRQFVLPTVTEAKVHSELSIREFLDILRQYFVARRK